MPYFQFYLLAAILLGVIPLFFRLNPIINYLSNVIVMPYTVIHELCHSMMTFCTFGKVKGIQLFANSSGLAFSSTGSSLSRFLTTFAGYTGSSLISVLFTHWIYTNNPAYVFYTYMAFSFITFLLIRNIYGFLYMGGFNAFCIYLLWAGQIHWIDHVAMYLTSVMIVQSLLFSFTILRLSKQDKHNAGDATALWNQTKIPTLFWGLFFFLFSCACVYYLAVTYIFAGSPR